MSITDQTNFDPSAVTELPLAGLRIIEISSFVAAPLGGMTLAQLGAEVIRIDPIGGAQDIDRWPLAPDGKSLFWNSLNSGKKSMTLDLRQTEAQEILAELVCADHPGGGILLTNMPDRPWNSYATLSAHRADVIRIALSGNFDGSPAVDYTINCAGGFAVATGDSNRPVNHVLPAWDMAAGLYLSTALLAADRHRTRTGRGQAIDLALSDVMVAMLGNLGYLADIQINGKTRGAMGNELYGAFGRDFHTKDGRDIMVVALTARQWMAISAATGLAANLPGVSPSGGDLFRARGAIAAGLEAWCVERDFDNISEVFTAHHVLWGPYNDFATFFREDPRCSLENPLMGKVDQPGIGPLHVAGSPLRFSQSGTRRGSVAPTLGADGAGVLRTALGLTQERIDQLKSRGILGGN